MTTPIVNVERIKGALECSICLDTYDNPRMLSCTHHFCKSCLDRIVTFNEDGSGGITCPFRCAKKTFLSVNETANDLIAGYDFMNLIEALNLNDSACATLQPPLCTKREGCQNHISLFCCGEFMCNSCYGGGGLVRKTDLKFNKKEHKMEAICTEHMSVCTFLCNGVEARSWLVDDEVLCRYCVHRNEEHRHHRMNLITNEIASLKAALDEALELFQQNNSIGKKKTEEYAKEGRQNLETVLKARKTDCLDQYSAFLDAEEIRLKEQYEGIVKEHMDQYQRPEWVLGKMLREDETLEIGLALYKEEMEENIDVYAESRPCTEEVLLSESSQYLSQHPLGVMNVKWGAGVVGISSLICNFDSE